MKKTTFIIMALAAILTVVSCTSTGSVQATYAYTSASAAVTQQSFCDMMKGIALEEGASEDVAEASVSFLRSNRPEDFLAMMGFDGYIGAHVTLKGKTLVLNGEEYPCVRKGDTITFAGDKVLVLSEDEKTATILLGDDEVTIAFPFYLI